MLKAYNGSWTNVFGVGTDVCRKAKMLIMSSRLMAKLQYSTSWPFDLDQACGMAFVGSKGLLISLLIAEQVPAAFHPGHRSLELSAEDLAPASDC